MSVVDSAKKRPALAAKSSPNKRPKYDASKAKSGSGPTGAGTAAKFPSKYKPKPGAAAGANGKAKFNGAAKKPFQKNKFANKPAPKAGGGRPAAAAAGAEESGVAAAPAGANPFEKQDWNKFKQDKKELKLKRKQGDNKDLFELTVEGKKIYEELRCKTTVKKEELATKLFQLLRGAENFQKLVLAHDTARIVQCLLKHSPAAIRTEIAEALIFKVPEMSVSKYAHFCVLRIVKYGTAEIRAKVIDALLGSVLRLAYNRFASTILDTLYVSYASSQQKAFLRQEWYGDLYKKSKDAGVKQIGDTYKDSPHIKVAIINALKANLEHVVNKKLVDSSLVHAVLLEFLTVCSEEERIEMAVSFNPYIPSLASTKDGSRAAMVIFFNSIVKDRRSIVKNLREHLIQLCTHEHGHVLILAIINSMDDTKALKKSIFDHIFTHIEYVAANEWGRRIVEWFVAPDDRTLFHPQIIGYLEAGLLNSKKDKAVRRAEVAEAVEQPLCAAIAANAKFWLRGGHTGLATAAILRRAAADGKLTAALRAAYESVAALLVQEDWLVPVKELEEKEPSDLTAKKRALKKAAPGGAAAAADGADGEEEDGAEPAAKKKKINPKILKKYKSPFEKEKEKAAAAAAPIEQIAGIEHAGLHIVLKKILKSDGERREAGGAAAASNEEHVSLGAALAEKLDADAVKRWLPLNRAVFLLLIAFETGDATTCERLRAVLKPHAALVKKQTHAAAKLLAKKVGL